MDATRRNETRRKTGSRVGGRAALSVVAAASLACSNSPYRVGYVADTDRWPSGSGRVSVSVSVCVSVSIHGLNLSGALVTNCTDTRTPKMCISLSVSESVHLAPSLQVSKFSSVQSSPYFPTYFAVYPSCCSVRHLRALINTIVAQKWSL